MFDVGASEFLLIVVVAIVVIGPKDLPMALRTAGRWIAKIRRVSGHFRSGIETMIREAELEEMERKWREQNEAIMQEHPATPDDPATPIPGSAESALLPPPDAMIEAPASGAERERAEVERAEPQLPLPPP
jgi:sec-independent protein translocase protein TatB